MFSSLIQGVWPEQGVRLLGWLLAGSIGPHLTGRRPPALILNWLARNSGGLSGGSYYVFGMSFNLPLRSLYWHSSGTLTCRLTLMTPSCIGNGV
jgi:hypothetical protein